MRTIEFRAIPINGTEFIFGDLCNFFTQGKCIMPSSYFATREFDEEVEDNEFPNLKDGFAIGEWFGVKPETVGQFTGLLDKNGVKIFEGDLVGVETEDGEYILHKGENEVKIIDGNWNPYVELGEYWYTLGQLSDQDVRVEIIGNIHQNK